MPGITKAIPKAPQGLMLLTKPDAVLTKTFESDNSATLLPLSPTKLYKKSYAHSVRILIVGIPLFFDVEGASVNVVCISFTNEN